MARLRYGWRGALVHLLLGGVLGGAGPAAAPLIWAFGDSLTAGYGLPPAQGFPAQLQAELAREGFPAIVRNGGVAGDTSAQGRARLLWGLRGLGARPDLVIVELGANDMLRGLAVEEARANLNAILAALRQRHIRVLVAGMRAAPNLGAGYARRFDAIFPALARVHGAGLYPFFLAGVAGDRRLIQADGLHPNARGVAIIVRRMAPAVRAALTPKREP